MLAGKKDVLYGNESKGWSNPVHIIRCFFFGQAARRAPPLDPFWKLTNCAAPR
jgi:hypothetical protein